MRLDGFGLPKISRLRRLRGTPEKTDCPLGNLVQELLVACVALRTRPGPERGITGEEGRAERFLIHPPRPRALPRGSGISGDRDCVWSQGESNS